MVPMRAVYGLLLVALLRSVYGQSPSVAQLLLAQKAAITNWDEFQAGNNITGWDLTTDVCSWTGIKCSNTGSVKELNFACWRDAGFCAVKARGTLVAELAQIPTLEVVDVRIQELGGPLPDWGSGGLNQVPFVMLMLGYNNFTGSLPETWGAGQFSQLRTLGLAVTTLNGTLPTSWGLPNAFPRMRHLTITNVGGAPASQKISGTLPSTWATVGAFPELAILDITHTDVTGTLPANFGSTALTQLRTLNLVNNNLLSTLPEAWSAPGAFNSLQKLQLSNNSLAGTLPDSWGAEPGAFAGLSTLTLDGNQLTGSIPDGWSTATAFPKLQTLEVGNNPQLCGPVPANLQPLICADASSCFIENGVPQLACGDSLPPGLAPGLAPESPPVEESPPVQESPPVEESPPPEESPPAEASPPPGEPSSPEPDPSSPSPSPDPSALAPPSPPDNTTVDGAGFPVPDDSADSSSSSSSAPIGAIVGGVVGGLLLATVLAFFALRPRKGWLRRKDQGPGPLPGFMGGGDGDLVDSLVPSASAKLADEAAMPTDSLLIPAGIQATQYTTTPSGLPASHLITGGHASPSAATAATVAAVGAAALAPGTASQEERQGSASASLHSLNTDPVLSLISSHMATVPPPALPPAIHSGGSGAATSGASSGQRAPSSSVSRRSSSGVLHTEMLQWEVQWQDIELERHIGGGSFGRVYLGHWKETEVAVKILISADSLTPSSLELPQSSVQKLQEEAGVMARMRHPNLVSFMGLCVMPPCILTEYCSRGSLYDVLRRARQNPDRASELTWQLRLSMAVDAARGLLYLHTATPAIIHRDVKSPNLLVDEHWHVKVSDFNLSKILEPQQNTSSTGGAANPLWLAPEIFEGSRASAATDVYGFAMVLWELLTWQLPWAGTPPFRVAHLVMNGGRPEVPAPEDLPGPDRLSPEALQAYIQLLRECWAQNPYDRPTFPELVPRLRALMSMGPNAPSRTLAPTTSIAGRQSSVGATIGSPV